MNDWVQVLSTNGDGTGTIEMTGDYSSTATEFSYDSKAVAALSAQTENYDLVSRILVFVQDSGAFDAEKYGNNIDLTNGIDIKVVDSEDNLLMQVTPAPIKTSGDWAALCHDVVYQEFGTGDKFLTARWTFSKFASDDGLRLNVGDRLVVTVNDLMTGLVHHRITAQGHTATEGPSYR